MLLIRYVVEIIILANQLHLYRVQLQQNTLWRNVQSSVTMVMYAHLERRF